MNFLRVDCERAGPALQRVRQVVTPRSAAAGVPLAGPATLSLDFLDDVRRMNKRQLYYQVLNFVSSALTIWKGLMVITGSESPVVVLSGSTEPAFHRGNLLFLTNPVEDPIGVGEIVIFRIEGREIPIVHRVLKIHEKGFAPYIGIVTILMNDYPKFKYAIFFLLGLFVLVHRKKPTLLFLERCRTFCY
ncbi:signal peptidase complex catalytic subunit SEC11A-like [Sciurus carolinensis]|uniref:signal peptidase complex catalytic subunit SEC11A-like n=1 Tax=Sciurus carolinensis TaxID=30640 RepID=UPI001FB4D838|nr:signal peptidase complex catalytic subunit SEC11A-like [Sciurus carolinensis]